MEYIDKYTGFSELVRYIVLKIQGIKTLELVQAIYFLELEYRIKFGESVIRIPIVRNDVGPVPLNYYYHLNKLKMNGIITARTVKRLVQHYASSETGFLTDIELENFNPEMDRISRIIQTYPARATDIFRREIFQTLPMKRFVKDEYNDQEFHIGREVLTEPYFLNTDKDTLAEARRIFRDHQRQALPFDDPDMDIGNSVQENMVLFLETTNHHKFSNQSNVYTKKRA